MFIINHINHEQYDQVKNIPSVKEVWDYLEKVGEGADLKAQECDQRGRGGMITSKFLRNFDVK